MIFVAPRPRSPTHLPLAPATFAPWTRRLHGLSSAPATDATDDATDDAMALHGRTAARHGTVAHGPPPIQLEASDLFGSFGSF